MSTPGSVAVPKIRTRALAKLERGGYTIREAVDAAILEVGAETEPLDDDTAAFVAEILTSGLEQNRSTK